MMHLRHSLLLVLAAGLVFGCDSGGSMPVEPVLPEPGTPAEPVKPAEPPTGARIVFATDTVVVNQGLTVQVRPRLLDPSGAEVSGASFDFSVTDAAVATITADGVLSGLEPGATDIRVSSGGVSGRAPVDVFGHPKGLHVGRAALGHRPFGIDISRDGVVYVTRLDAQRVSSLDVETRAVSGEVVVGTVPTGITFHPDGQTAYVTNQHGGGVGVIDVATNVQVANILLNANPFITFVTPDGSKLYILTDGQSVHVASTATRAITHTIPVGSGANGIALAPGDTLLYVSSTWSGTVTEIDVRTDAVLRTFTPGGVPQAVVVSKDGSELYVANEAGWLDIYSLDTGAPLSQVALAGGGFGMALSPDQSHLYISLAQAGRLQVVNIPARRVIHTFELEGVPRRIAFTRHGGIAVVANEGGWVDFIR